MCDTPAADVAVRILVVDDFAPWRDTICSILKTQANLRVVGQAADGLEAVRKTDELKPALVLLDISIPLLDGINAAVRILQDFPGIRIIFLSQNGDSDIVRAALTAGAHGYVLKMDAGAELLPAIDGVLRGGQFRSSGLDRHGPIVTSDD